MTAEKTIRLQKYIAQCGLASRRKAEEFITAGRITVNGETVTTPGTCIRPGIDQVKVDNTPAMVEEVVEYFLLNKPKGYVTTLSDPQGRPVVTSLIQDNTTRIFPVGRLDYDTEGALLLTNDGNLAQKIQHPSFQTKKTYEAVVYGHPGKTKLTRLSQGILLENTMTAPAQITLLKKWKKTSLIRLTIHEGRKHQVKKMLKAIGHPVASLKRTAYGQLHLHNLPTGASRKLSLADIEKIFL